MLRNNLTSENSQTAAAAGMGSLSPWVVPAVAHCRELLQLPRTELLLPHTIAQRDCPRSVTTVTATAVKWLHDQSINAELAPVQREAAEAAFLMWPKLLLCSPIRADTSERLAPHARPQLLQQRLELVQSGRWQPCAPDAAPTGSGTPEPRLGQAPSEGRPARNLVRSWRQLWGYGVASADAKTVAHVRQKWGAATAALPAPHPSMSTAMAYELSKGTSFLAAIGRLKPRIAADATGMTAELIHWMIHHPLLRAVTQSYLALVMRRSVTDTAKFILLAAF
eukprot:3963834-Amphidinium_carterae.1